MTTPRTLGNTGLGNTGLGDPDIGPIEPPDIPPLDPEEIRQRHLLAEAVLESFQAQPSRLVPYGRAKLTWEITMPTTVIPGITVEVHLAGAGDQLVDPKGSRIVAPYVDTTYAIYLRTPLASRHLGNVDVVLDMESCALVNTAPGVFSALARGEAERAFPAGGQLTLRGGGATVDIGYNSFVVDIPLKSSVPDWFDPDVDVAIGFSVASDKGDIVVTHDLAITKVSFGALSSVLSAGCSAMVATAVEHVSDGFLSGFIGPVVAGRLERQLEENMRQNRDRLNAAHPRPLVPFRFFDSTLTAAEGLTFRYCPASAEHPPLGGGGADQPIHP